MPRPGHDDVFHFQIEKNFRLDYLYKWRMREDKLEYEKNEMLNNMLLANILPVHVAKHFLTPGLRAKNVSLNALAVFSQRDTDILWTYI